MNHVAMPHVAANGNAPTVRLHMLTLGEAADALRTGALGAEDYASALLQRHRDHAALRAFVQVDAAVLLEAARQADRSRVAGDRLGRLHGVPIALKDNIAADGLPTTAGTAALAAARSARNAGVVERLCAEGALVFGKNTMHELAMGWTSDNAHFGRPANPHAPERIAGGSSGGSAAAVAAMLVPAAIGSDTNGSIRIPAALCGIAGFRPSVGRYPTEGVVPLSHTLDTVGPMARSVADLALLDSIMAGQPADAPMTNLEGVRIAISPRYYLSRLTPEVAAVFEATRRRLIARGAICVEADLPQLQALSEGIAPILIGHESATGLPDWLAARTDGVSMDALIAQAGPDLVAALQAGRHGVATNAARQAYHQALRRRAALSDAMHRYFAEHRVQALMHPVTRTVAPMAAAAGEAVSPAPDVQLADGSRMTAREAFGQNVSPASIAALPSLVLRGGLTPQRLPVGIAFDAPHGSDARLLALGHALESALASDAPTRSFLDISLQAIP
ncbi:MAG: amidase family protein [Pseudomonadota bacterium]